MSSEHRPVEARLEDLFRTDLESHIAGRIDELVRGRLASSSTPRDARRYPLRAVGTTAALLVVAALALVVALIVASRPPGELAAVAGTPPASAAGAGTAAPVATVIVREQNAYPLDDSPAAAAAFPGNSLILRGRIAGVGEPTWTSSDHDIGHIYTPVTLEVEEVLRGPAPSGRDVIVQSLGGTVGDIDMEFSDSPALAALPVESELVVFMAAPEPGSFEPAAPNMVYRVDGGVATSLARPDERIALADLINLVRTTVTGS